MSGEVTNTDPGYIKDGWLSKPNKRHWKKAQHCRPLKDTPEARESARLINEFTKKASDVLRKSAVNRRRERKKMMAANIILVRDTGDHLPKIKPFYRKHELKLGAFAQMPCEKAIARLADIKQILPKNSACSYKRLAKDVATQIVKLDGVYIHLKGPDEYGHSKDPKGKKKAIERIDKEFFNPLLASLDMKNTIIAVTSDHATECRKGIHTNAPNPLLIYSPSMRPGHKKKFCEKECKKGQLKTTIGKNLIKLLKNMQTQRNN